MTVQATTEESINEGVFSLPILMRDIAVVLTAAALCLVLWSNISDLGRGKAELVQLIARQESKLKATASAEKQLDSLAHAIQQLSASGNPNAQKIVALLQANGVHIKP